MYLINGQLNAELALDAVLERLQAQLPALLNHPPRSEEVFDCAEAFVQMLRTSDPVPMLDEEQRQALMAFCDRKHLGLKLERELGLTPRSLRRIDYCDGPFESWQPLGLVVHVTPGNSPLLGFCAALEGLLAGNVNWLRPSTRDGDYTARLLAAFLACDPSGRLRDYLAVLPVPAQETGRLFALAQGVSAWGGETALTALREQIPSGCRWIDWGHRISFAYISSLAASAQALDSLVDEICRLDQQACSSPQWLLVDSDEPARMQALGDALAAAFERRAGHWPALETTTAEACEITTRTALARLDYSFAGKTGQVWSGNGWRILWEHHQKLQPSPLFRTLLLRPVPEGMLAETLLPWRNVLQSCALICEPERAPALARRLITAGVTRVTSTAQIQQGYDGEPHDGVYALQRLSRRVSVGLQAQVANHRVTLDASPAALSLCPSTPILDKTAFMALPPAPKHNCSSAPAAAAAHRCYRPSVTGISTATCAPPPTDCARRAWTLRRTGSSIFLRWQPVRRIPQFHENPRTDECRALPHERTTRRQFRRNRQADCRAPDQHGGRHAEYLASPVLQPAADAARLRWRAQSHVGRRTPGAGKPTAIAAMWRHPHLLGHLRDRGRRALGHACIASGDGVFHLMDDIQTLEIVRLEDDAPVGPGNRTPAVHLPRTPGARPPAL